MTLRPSIAQGRDEEDEMKITSSTSNLASTVTDIVDFHYAHDKEGLRMGFLERLRYAALVLLGKRRNYPICICAFGRDDEDWE